MSTVPSRPPGYWSWMNLKNRCSNPNCPDYPRYGGRGITVCERWLESFRNFYEDMGPKPGPEYTIDRRNNDLGYYKDNCRWATQTEQQKNRSDTHQILHDGAVKTMTDLALETGRPWSTIATRLAKGMTVEQAIAEVHIRKYDHDGKSLTLVEWSKILNVPEATLYYRIHVYKIPLDRALTTNVVRKDALLYTFNGKSLRLREWADELNLKYTTLYRRVMVLKWPLEKAFTPR